MAASEECIFCRIGRGEVPSEKVFDDATAFAIRDINPKAPVHLLLIPYAHVEALADATAEVLDRVTADSASVRLEGIEPETVPEDGFYVQILRAEEPAADNGE